MRNPMDLSGRTVLVTGASSGIGRHTSVLLSQLGATLVLAARNPARLEETRTALKGTGHHVEIVDLDDTNAIPRWIKRLTSDTGPLHGLVHSAGVHLARPLSFLRLDDLERLMRVNFEAAVALAKGFRQKGCASPEGSIVFLSSVVGLVGQPGVSAYAASKGALIAFAKSLALELARERIRVNCVAPGFVRTEMAGKLKEALTDEQFSAIEAMHPLGLGSPDDIACAIAFLLAETGRWITGTTLVVDGGYTAH